MLRPNIPVVMYHSINDHIDAHPLGFLAFTTDEFRQQLRFFRDSGFSFVTIDEIYRRALAGNLGNERIVVLTFDDGFLDNYLVAEEIMREYDAKGTIFVNPGHAPGGEVRQLSDVPNAWGHLNFAEMRLLEQNGVFDIQSHTMTHEMVFSSDRIIDFYEPSKFGKYHWLVWMLHPETLKSWNGDVYRYAELIPTGYPIFEYDRCVFAKAFHPSDTFVEDCCSRFQHVGHSALSELQKLKNKGVFESEKEYVNRADLQLREAKQLLETELNKEVIGLCLPGGAYDERIIGVARGIGHRLVMLSSRDQQSDNALALTTVTSDKITGLKRVSFSKDYPGFLRGKRAAYWSAKLKVGTFMGDPLVTGILQLARSVRNIFKHITKRFI
ncbi:polysaccharide deacetylase family protein [Desulfoluna spongiiphila]|uniref:polysaccharide deacetylase family protein n=1 Tax=Desulfoluna spongiiphila TaxID=419481 RepID=UPI001251E856|nr:polysaccharide deacetylase family protein [Desulfoluna spongiiphila]VVS94872.1 glycoside hydrolase/deacetylase beta/alpha-barrel [Desulfoluna spongiiphila]